MAAIFIVEGRPIDRKFLEKLLKSAGHSVTSASDGVKGLRLARRTPPLLLTGALGRHSQIHA